jgi:hypothetical protein
MIPGFGAGLVIETRSLPNLLVATLATLPSMSLIPSAPFPICGNRRQCARCNWEKILLRRGYGGTSVVVQAPTGSGKTYIFELLYPNLKTQSVFTVPTRASGNTAQSHRPQTSAARTAATTENLRIYAS